MERTKNNMLAPILVLVAICLVASAMLAGIFQVASPIIDARAESAATEARSAVLPEGSSFTKWEGELVDGVKDAYTADNGAGMVCSTSFNGFGGAVELMIGMDSEGAVTGIQVMEQSETPGVGSNALTEAYRSKFTGEKSADGVDAYSGATFTSKAVKKGVNAAAAQFALIGSAEPGENKSEEEIIATALDTLFPDGKPSKLDTKNTAEGVLAVYSNEGRSQYAMLVEKVGYNKEDVVRVIVGIDSNGAVNGVIPVHNKEIEGIGDTALSDEKYLAQFTGITEIEEAAAQKSVPAKKGSDAVTVDAVSNATETCSAVVEAVRSALAQYAAGK